MHIKQYWQAVLQQDADALRTYFLPDAYVNWHNTNEHFTAEEFIRANCEYPGSWTGKIQRLDFLGDLIITVVRIWSKDNAASYHVTSFLRIRDGKIASIDEYWGDDGPAPQWRLDKKLGTPIL